jgi:molecular chaperone DnaJ
MTFQGDPYRILGVMPGASVNEIRAAYRRLAKQYHPDAAGERALARFLAIQAAYEHLVDGEGRLRGPAAARGAGGRRAREPWRADPARARASREAWRARRSGGTNAGASARNARSDGDAGRASDAGPRPGPDPTAGGRTTGSERSGRRGPRRATPGSTTYDEASDSARDPEWDGGAWYGPSLGTYWTINPREYADPRKHGPEYQARARRAGAAEEARSTDTARDADDERSWTYAADRDGAWTADRAAGDTPDGSAEPAHATWASPSSATAADASDGRATGDGAPGPTFPDLESLARQVSPRHLLALAQRDWRWRGLVALIGWLPIGLAVGSVLTSVTGCAEFAASCPDPVPTIALIVQPLIPLLLALAPPVAALAAFGTIAALVAAVPLTAILAVGSGPDGHAGAPLLGVMVTIVYLAALAGGAVVLWRPAREP